MSTIRSLLSLLLIAQIIYAKTYSRCELKGELLNIHKLSIDESRRLTCVARKFSALSTNVEVSGKYGIFQISKKWCGENEAGGDCNIRCKDLLDDDLTDDILCAKKVFEKLGKRAWNLNKSPGCEEEFKYLDENCHKEILINDDSIQVQQDFCEFAGELMTLYDISKKDAMIWSCIKDYSKTGNLSSQEKEKEDVRIDHDDQCVKTRDIECAIKKYKQTRISSFINWPGYSTKCKNIPKYTCFELPDPKFDDKSNIREKVEQIKNFGYPEITTTTRKPETKILTTSTEISVIIEDGDITTENIGESQQTTEFLSNTLEKPSNDEKSTIEGYSRVRIMFPDKANETLESISIETTTELSKQMLINDSLSQSSTTKSTISEPTHVKSQKTDGIELKHFETVDKCLIARSMNNSGRILKNLIPTFICIAEHESGLNLSFVNTDGLQSRYGLFQIDNQIYCSTSNKKDSCEATCSDLVDDEFDDDFECIRHIYKRQGLDYWPSYEKFCKNVNTNSLDYCFEQFTTSHRPSTIDSKEIETNTMLPTESTIEHNDLIETETVKDVYDGDSIHVNDALEFCDLSHQIFVNESMELDDLVNYACIADKSSQLKLYGTEGKFGIFGLNENSCGTDEIGGLCSILCSDLLNAYLEDDVKCAIKIFKNYGLDEWNINKSDCYAYKNRILQCITEGKFPLPSEDSEESDSSFLGSRSSVDKNEQSSGIESIPEKDSTGNLMDLKLTTVEAPKLLVSDIENTSESEYTENHLFTISPEGALSNELPSFNQQKLEDEESSTVSSITSKLKENESLKESTEYQETTTNSIDEVELDEILSKLKNSQNDEENEMTHGENRSDLNSVENLFLKIVKNLTESQDETTLKKFSSSEIEIEPTTIEPLESFENSQATEAEYENSLNSGFEETENMNLKSTTESLYYTSIREIIQEYEKIDIENAGKLNSLSKRNQISSESDDQTSTLSNIDFEDTTEMDEINLLSSKDDSTDQTTQENEMDVTSQKNLLSYVQIDKCALARYMNDSSFDKNLIPVFLCIAEHESKFNVSSIVESGRQTKYGLFQIDDNVYCSTNEKINECDVLCEHLIDNQYDNDFECVSHIYKTEGFNYWKSYQESCTNIDLYSLDHCYEQFTTSHRPYTIFNKDVEIKKILSTTTEPSQMIDVPRTEESDLIIEDDNSSLLVRKFQLCELARELYSNNISTNEIPSYLCIAGIKSQFEIRLPNETDQSYGLFSIDSDFCGQNESDGVCSMKCSELLNNDISDDIECIYKIIETNSTTEKLDEDECDWFKRRFYECVINNEFQTSTVSEIPKNTMLDEDYKQVKFVPFIKSSVTTESTPEPTTIDSDDTTWDMAINAMEDIEEETSVMPKYRSKIADIEAEDYTTKHIPEITTIFELSNDIDENTEDNTKGVHEEEISDTSTISDDESIETTTIEPILLKQTTSSILKILINPASMNNEDSTTEFSNAKHDTERKIIENENVSNQVAGLLRNITNTEILPKNGSVIINVYNLYIYGDNHEIKYSVHPTATQTKNEN